MTQIIHCNHNSGYNKHLRRRVYTGSTWVLSSVPDNPFLVSVQHTICNPTDNYCRKIGRELAFKAKEVVMPKTKLLEYVSNKAICKGLTKVPNPSQLYQSIIRL